MSQRPIAIGRGGDILAGRLRLGMSAHDLWVGYFSLGGNATPAEIDDWLSGAEQLPAREYDVLAHTLNETFSEIGLNHPIAYSDTF